MRNKSRLEGSITKGYLAEECMTFYSRYLGGIETKFNKVGRNFDGGNVESSKRLSVFRQIGRAPRKATPQELSREDLFLILIGMLCKKTHP